jgi:predicted HTH domain antitoxin
MGCDLFMAPHKHRGPLLKRRSTHNMAGSIDQVKVEVTLPQAVFVAMQGIGLEGPALASEMKRATAIDLFRKGLLSIGKAAELADLPLAEFMDLLVETGVPVAEYTTDDLQQDEATLDNLRQ